MLTDRIALRPRGAPEAIDLGFRLVQSRWPAIATATCLASLPGVTIAALAWLWHPPLALLALWWCKPLIDRTVLAMLAAELTEQPISARKAAARGLGEGVRTLFLVLLWLRWHPARSMVLPINQLEGLSGTDRRRRTRALGHGVMGGAAGLTFIALVFEACIMLGLFTLTSWLLPASPDPQYMLGTMPFGQMLPATSWAYGAALYLGTIILIEPFYAGGGFGLYLNQRCRLECWDLEFMLRRLAERHGMERAA